MGLKWKIAQAAEIRWWSRYLKNKDKTTYYDWKKQYWTGFLKDIRYALPEEKLSILDAGSGPAGIFTILDQHDVVAVDPLLDKYVDSLDQFDVVDFPHVRFVNSTIEQISMDQQYDVIFCLNCINHVSSLQSSLQNLYTALKPGGKIIISTDAHNYDLLKNIFQYVPGDILHPHQYNIKDYQSLVQNAGFDIGSSIKVSSEFIFGYWVIQANRPS